MLGERHVLGSCETPNICDIIRQQKISKIGKCWFTLSNPPHPIGEICRCQGNMLCGYCYVVGITMTPENIPECRKCSADLNNFITQVDNILTTDVVIRFKARCYENCLWWEWFHNKRLEIARKNNICFKYTKH